MSLFMSKTMLEVGWSFILCYMFYLEGWSSRSSYFIGVALPVNPNMLIMMVSIKLNSFNSAYGSSLSYTRS